MLMNTLRISTITCIIFYETIGMQILVGKKHRRGADDRIALDIIVEVLNSGWSHFPDQGAYA